jgi:hypothetical protein
MPPLSRHSGCQYSTSEAAQTAEPQSFALRQPATPVRNAGGAYVAFYVCASGRSTVDYASATMAAILWPESSAFPRSSSDLTETGRAQGNFILA